MLSLHFFVRLHISQHGYAASCLAVPLLMGTCAASTSWAVKNNAAMTSFWVQAVTLQNVPPRGVSNCFLGDRFQVLCISFPSPADGFPLRHSPAAIQHLCPALSLAGGTAWRRRGFLWPQQSGAVLLPASRSRCHCPPGTMGPEPQGYFRPFVVNLAWENLRSQLLDTTAVLRGLKVIPGLGSFGLVAQPLASGSHRPPAGPPGATRAREQKMHHWGGLPVDKMLACGIGCG